ncbi:MAG: hypothetical protein A2664_02670 [Candidatus Taylorbacteria bacterium RIFCSPHIGHO2_01_FULL_46_22b]|uniref:Uncharacterized protein n=1 Tax=Candidatus Taylorbacteria bacterium RIFCSPHIGHO2_01_FULL_46_22b TaxID=1802301 RepID=A0A1G2M3S4_9BACT|nr:MAG: hypothetical protein A2664_02670 [Candidatus Taylorbacteria bacterium RIFCSPHIGHO2_01_FULL_46_22b]
MSSSNQLGLPLRKERIARSRDTFAEGIAAMRQATASATLDVVEFRPKLVRGDKRGTALCKAVGRDLGR